VALSHRHRVRVLKGGFAAVRRLLHHPLATDYALTAIAVENKQAQRILGANLPGMPIYRALETFSTFALLPRNASAMPIQVRPATREDLPALAACLERAYRRYQFAPVWRARDLVNPAVCSGLSPGDFLVVRQGPRIVACVGLWDQNGFKQTVVRGYERRLAVLRPLVNLAAPVLRMPRLPEIGHPLRQVYLSHLAVEADDPHLFAAMLDSALAEARRRGYALALTGLATRHPLAAIALSRYRPREYRTLLYLVEWSRGRGLPTKPGAALPHVEIATL
jgi:hypothetical protein